MTSEHKKWTNTWTCEERSPWYPWSLCELRRQRETSDGDHWISISLQENGSVDMDETTWTDSPRPKIRYTRGRGIYDGTYTITRGDHGTG